MSEVKEGLALGNKALTLVDKVFGPWFTRRQADADARAVLQGTLAEQVANQLELYPNDPVLLDAIASCKGKMGFDNLVRIVQQAIPAMNENARPELVSDDWYAHLRDKASSHSDPDMTTLWAQLLAGECNSPGSFARKTITILGDMEPEEARLFRRVANFRIISVMFKIPTLSGSERQFGDGYDPMQSILVITSVDAPVYKGAGLDGRALDRLEWLGLIVRGSPSLQLEETANDIGDYHVFECPSGSLFVSGVGRVPLGVCSFTPAGEELAALCTPLSPDPRFRKHVADYWTKHGFDARRHGRFQGRPLRREDSSQSTEN